MKNTKEIGADRVERRLAAILAADVAGYSRLIGADEEGTLAALRTVWQEVIEPGIAEHRGRIVKTTGDGLLAEFASVVDALRCAVAVQDAVTRRNAGAPERAIAFRIGVHQGDIVVEGDDIFGDGVNIAARLEGLAEPGGICVSARVQEDAAGKLDLAFEDIGEQHLKNIARSVRVYRVGGGHPAAAAQQPLSLPDKPSIAVLPFQNMSGDPEQEYFADGMVEEITTAIARVPWLFVIARNSSFTYKGKAVDVKQVARELGVRYLLEGSVRKAGDRVRITGQLIDATSGNHIWADRFDGSLDDVFELQDQVASSIAGAIEPKLRQSEIERASRKPTGNLDAYDLYLRALVNSSQLTEARAREGIVLLKAALAIDPSYAIAAARLSQHYMYLNSLGFRISAEELAEAGQLSAQAIRLGNDDPEALSIGAHGAIYFGRAYGVAESASERALAMNPNSADAWAARGWVLALRNRPEPAIEAFQRAMRLSPLDPQTWYFVGGIAFAYLYMRRFDDVVEWADRSLDQKPDFLAVRRVKLVACAQLGRIEEARHCLRQVLERQPELTIARLTDYPGMTVSPEILELCRDGFRRAGLPEE